MSEFTHNRVLVPNGGSLAKLHSFGAAPSIPAPPITTDGIRLIDCWKVISRFRRLILALLGVALLSTSVFIFYATPNFIASSTLLIEPEPPQVLDIRELISESGSTEDHDYYKTQYDLLTSRDLAASVIRSLDLEQTGLFDSRAAATDPIRIFSAIQSLCSRLLSLLSTPAALKPERNGVSAKAIDAYLKRLKIEPGIGTRLVVVSFTAPDPILAARVTNEHVRHFIRQGLDLRSQSCRIAVEFLESQLIGIKQRTQQSEAALNLYRHHKGIVSFDVEDTNKVAQHRMEDLTNALTDAETKRISAEAQMQQVRAGDYDSLPQVVSNPTITVLKPQVRRLQAEFASLATAFNPRYPKLAELKAELDEARRSLDKEIRAVAGATRRDYIAAVNQENELKAEVAAEKERDLAMNDASLQDAVLAREVEANRDLYKNVLQRMQQIEVGEEAPVTNVSVVDYATPPLLPSEPKKLRDLALSSLLALFCGIALGFALDQFDNRLKTSDEIESYLHLSCLAVAPDFALLHKSLASNSWLGTFRKFLASAGAGTSRQQCSRPAMSEVYRSIRTALTFSRAGAPPKKILVTSTIEGEGKTWTALHIALAFAHTGAKTLLVDADLRRAQCHSAFDVDNDVGLSEVLVGQLEPEEAIQFIASRNLFFLSAGSPVPNPAELLTSTRMLEVLESLSLQFQYILIDSAPLMYASDTVGIATMADGVVLVAGVKTPKHRIRRVSERLALSGATIFGAVLNRVDIHHPDHCEYARYYSYDRTAPKIIAERRELKTLQMTD
jgi:polysaccharide biosynthesis transport protein